MKQLFILGAAMALSLTVSSASAQNPAMGGSAASGKVAPAATGRALPGGRSMAAPVEKSYADSNEFKAVFKEFYPLVKPQATVQERAAKQFKSASRNLKDRGMDSAESFNKVLAMLDENIDEAAMFKTYRANLSAQELKIYMDFMKTPAGKHILEVAPRLSGARNDGDQQIRKAIMTVVPPMPRDPNAPRPGQSGVDATGAPKARPNMRMQNGTPNGGVTKTMPAPTEKK